MLGRRVISLILTASLLIFSANIFANNYPIFTWNLLIKDYEKSNHFFIVIFLDFWFLQSKSCTDTSLLV